MREQDSLEAEMLSDDDDSLSPHAFSGTAPRPRLHPTPQQQALRLSLSGASGMLTRPDQKEHSFEVRDDGQAHAQVHDTVALRAAFLLHCGSSMLACEMQLAAEGPFMSAQQFTAMARDVGLVEPEGITYATCKDDAHDGLSYPHFLDALLEMAFECGRNVAAELQAGAVARQAQAEAVQRLRGDQSLSSAAARMLRTQSGRARCFSSESGVAPQMLRPSPAHLSEAPHGRGFSEAGVGPQSDGPRTAHRATFSAPPPQGRGFSETGARLLSRPGTAHRARFSGSGCSSRSPRDVLESSGGVASVHSGPQLGTLLACCPSPGLERLNTISRIRDRVAASARRDDGGGPLAASGGSDLGGAVSPQGLDVLSLPGSRFSSPSSSLSGAPPQLGSLSGASGSLLRPGTAVSPLGRLVTGSRETSLLPHYSASQNFPQHGALHPTAWPTGLKDDDDLGARQTRKHKHPPAVGDYPLRQQLLCARQHCPSSDEDDWGPTPQIPLDDLVHPDFKDKMRDSTAPDCASQESCSSGATSRSLPGSSPTEGPQTPGSGDAHELPTSRGRLQDRGVAWGSEQPRAPVPAVKTFAVSVSAMCTSQSGKNCNGSPPRTKMSTSLTGMAAAVAAVEKSVSFAATPSSHHHSYSSGCTLQPETPTAATLAGGLTGHLWSPDAAQQAFTPNYSEARPRMPTLAGGRPFSGSAAGCVPRPAATSAHGNAAAAAEPPAAAAEPPAASGGPVGSMPSGSTPASGTAGWRFWPARSSTAGNTSQVQRRPRGPAPPPMPAPQSRSRMRTSDDGGGRREGWQSEPGFPLSREVPPYGTMAGKGTALALADPQAAERSASALIDEKARRYGSKAWRI